MLSVEGLWKVYTSERGKVQAVKGISFNVEKGEFFTLLGPSGCGKTTILRCIAGLENPEAGTILLKGELLFSSQNKKFVPPYRRNISMVFQSYAIWPHMSVYDNVAFPLKVRSIPKVEEWERTMRTLELVGLGGLESRPATDLSGGQQQRVAVARAIVRDVDLLLFDEPLSNLDSKLRLQMRFELRQLQKKLGITSIYVTHDQEEALIISDWVAVMDNGVIVEVGKSQDIYLAPKNLFTANFVGQSNILPGKIVCIKGEVANVETIIGKIVIRAHDLNLPKEGFIMIRPEHVSMSWIKEELPSFTENVFEGTITSATFTGKLMDYLVKIGDSTLGVQMPLTQVCLEGSRVYIHLSPDRCVMLPHGSK